MSHVEGHAVKGSGEHRHNSGEAAVCQWTASVHHRYSVRWRCCDWSGRERMPAVKDRSCGLCVNHRVINTNGAHPGLVSFRASISLPAPSFTRRRRDRRCSAVTDDRQWHPVTSDLLMFRQRFRFSCRYLRAVSYVLLEWVRCAGTWGMWK